MHKLSVYIPESHLNIVKEALFAAGAGRVGNYDCCAWQTRGQGQFRPLTGANPTKGVINHIETVVEYCVEMVCDEQYLPNVICALKKTHPYETPAYSTWKISC